MNILIFILFEKCSVKTYLFQMRTVLLYVHYKADNFFGIFVIYYLITNFN